MLHRFRSFTNALLRRDRFEDAIDALRQDFRYALRALRRRPGFALLCMEPMTIVGVVGDVRQYGPSVEASPECHLPYLQHDFNNATLSIVVRTSGDPGLLADTMRQKAHERSPDVSVKATTMEVLVGAAAMTQLLTAMLFEIKPNDGITSASVVALLGVMSTLAIYLPARRSSRIEPLIALRAE